MHKLNSKKEKAASSGKQGFTLIELLLAMAIISILSGAILVSISAQRQRAYQSRMLAELSGTIQPMLMCRTDGNNISSPTGTAGGGPICAGINAYGLWPSTTGLGNYSASTNVEFNSGTWFLSVGDTSKQICCNSSSGKCHDVAAAFACGINNPPN